MRCLRLAWAFVFSACLLLWLGGAGTLEVVLAETDYEALLEAGRARSLPEVASLAARMPHKAPEIRRLNEAVWGMNIQEGSAALGRLAELGAGSLVGRALEHPDDWVQAEAGSVLKRLGNKAYVPQLLATLKATPLIPRGGSEAQVARGGLVYALVSALDTLTGLGLGPVDVRDYEEVNQVIARVEVWLESHTVSSAGAPSGRVLATGEHERGQGLCDAMEMVSARPAAAVLGLSVYWNSEQRAAAFGRDGRVLWVRPTESVATLDGQPFPLEAAPYIENDRLILPLSALTQAFGLTLTEAQVEQVTCRIAD